MIKKQDVARSGSTGRPMDTTQKLLIDFYTGASGPTLLLVARSASPLKQLRDLFVSVSTEAERHAEELFKKDWVEPSASIRSLVLRRLTNRKAEPTKTFRLLTQERGAVLEWSRHEEGWLECADKLHALRLPGHQYLTIGAFNDALVEASYVEHVSRSE